jgi:hypothetical protein
MRRKASGPRRRKSRRLWLQIKYDAPGVSPQKVARTLIKSIERGDYEYPADWHVVISWRNKLFADMKTPGEFTAEMKASAKSSSGWDSAVIRYLERKLQ